MPIYVYRCENCQQEYEEYVYSSKNIEEEIEIEECTLPTCPNVVKRVFVPGRIGFIKKGRDWPDKERSIDKHMQEVHRAMNEGFTSQNEYKEGMDMLREREKEKGLPEGHLSGNRPKETAEVTADGKASIDRLSLAKKLDIEYKERTGVNAPIEQIVRMTDDRIKQSVGETVTVQRTKRQGREQLKRRAKEQQRDRLCKV